MSGRFAEREHRRAHAAPPLEDVTKQIEAIADQVVEAQRVARLLSKEMGAMLHALDALRLDVEATRTTQTTKTKQPKAKR